MTRDIYTTDDLLSEAVSMFLAIADLEGDEIILKPNMMKAIRDRAKRIREQHDKHTGTE